MEQADQDLSERIRERAHEIWVASGYLDGEADQHWLAAEHEIEVVTTEPQPTKTTDEVVTTEPQPMETTGEVLTTEPRPRETTDEVVTTEPRPRETTGEVVTTGPRPPDENDEVVEAETQPANDKIAETGTQPTDMSAEVEQTEIRPDLAWDAEAPGLCVRVYGNGEKSFVFVYRRDDRQRFVRIGTTPRRSLEGARRWAKELRSAVERGEDPEHYNPERQEIANPRAPKD
jgi:hypothetical protein